MKKLIGILFLALFLSSCDFDNTPQKPFVIISKSRYQSIEYAPGMTDYTYISSNGVKV